MIQEQSRQLDESNDMPPVQGTVDIDVPPDVLWQCFRQCQPVAALECLHVLGQQSRSGAGPKTDLGL